MISNRNTHSSCRIIKQKYAKDEPVPSEKVKIGRNYGESKYSSNDQKTACHPLYSIKRNIFEHDEHDLKADS